MGAFLYQEKGGRYYDFVHRLEMLQKDEELAEEMRCRNQGHCYGTHGYHRIWI